MGWIKLDRQIQDNFLWFDESFTKAQAWIDLILLANHEDTQIMFNGQFKIIKRGQHLTSIRKLQMRWKWSRNRVIRFLDILRDAGMIEKGTAGGTLLTLVNYDKFQSQGYTKGDTQGYTKGNTEGEMVGTQTRTIRNKEYKNSSTNRNAWMDAWAAEGEDDDFNEK